jgi:hypothetical protein
VIRCSLSSRFTPSAFVFTNNARRKLDEEVAADRTAYAAAAVVHARALQIEREDSDDDDDGGDDDDDDDGGDDDDDDEFGNDDDGNDDGPARKKQKTTTTTKDEKKAKKLPRVTYSDGRAVVVPADYDIAVSWLQMQIIDAHLQIYAHTYSPLLSQHYNYTHLLILPLPSLSFQRGAAALATRQGALSAALAGKIKLIDSTYNGVDTFIRKLDDSLRKAARKIRHNGNSFPVTVKAVDLGARAQQRMSALRGGDNGNGTDANRGGGGGGGGSGSAAVVKAARTAAALQQMVTDELYNDTMANAAKTKVNASTGAIEVVESSAEPVYCCRLC